MGLWDGINDKVNWLKGKVSGVVDKIKGWFTGQSGFDEHSPSKWAKKVFEYVVYGGIQGFEDSENDLKKSTNSIVNTVKKGMNLGELNLPIDNLQFEPINEDMQNATISYKNSANGKGTSAMVNSMISAINDNNQNINVYIGGKKIASEIYQPLMNLMQNKEVYFGA